MSLASAIDDSILVGQRNAVLIEWSIRTDLLGTETPSPEDSIAAAKSGLEAAGWIWNQAERRLERDGWQVWFRSQGLLSAPIAQWSRIEGHA